ncbi:MAG: hypothetical protein DME54_13240 [Verrucomicrobia bacterium]|nr:MAG: hypothetical protein DME62_01200 [Verrucomicrobiota bacterium]PYK33205.1 MAG: hypothetical protein DME54_13240 [Verrucomicrobiota bacterium]PYL20292.1 MAG: hypothetical protein DMF41_06720 [Verrucomicrobiota bacterium]PYL79934.1 MAG: hypothetical protein DMF21_10950 [Verrucomicrobiota bacterium]
MKTLRSRGILLVVISLAAFGCSPPSHPPRYQVIVTRDQVIKLDNESGQSWVLQCTPGNVCFWREIEIARTQKAPAAP